MTNANAPRHYHQAPPPEMNADMLTALLLSISLSLVDDSDTISVTATGEAEATSETLELSTTISATEKLASDAIVKQASFREQFDSAMEAVDANDLTITSRGLQVRTTSVSRQQRQIMTMNRQTIPSAEITVEEVIVLRFTAPQNDTDTLRVVQTILDTATDLGVAFTPSDDGRLIRPVVEDETSLQSKSVQAALKDARSQADEIAALASRQVAGIKQVTMQKRGAVRTTSVSNWPVIVSPSASESQADPASSMRTTTAKTTLTVVFRLAAEP